VRTWENGISRNASAATRCRGRLSNPRPPGGLADRAWSEKSRSGSSSWPTLTSGPDIARRRKSLEITLFRFKLMATEILEILEWRAGPGGAGQADQ
jgi:hypothetical protein